MKFMITSRNIAVDEKINTIMMLIFQTPWPGHALYMHIDNLVHTIWHSLIVSDFE